MSQIDTFEAMLARGQDSEMLRYTLGNSYFKEGLFDKAIEHLSAAVDMKPDYSSAWKLLGRALSGAEKHDEALVVFDKGLAAAQSNGDKQVEKEINVFRRRAEKKLAENAGDNSQQ